MYLRNFGLEGQSCLIPFANLHAIESEPEAIIQDDRPPLGHGVDKGFGAATLRCTISIGVVGVGQILQVTFDGTGRNIVSIDTTLRSSYANRTS